MKLVYLLRWKDSVLLLACIFVSSLALGCKTIPSSNVGEFSLGVTKTRSQSQEAFAAVDQLTAITSIDYAAKQPTLSESNFVAGLDQNGLQLWDQALGHLKSYAQHLQNLTAPELSKDFEDQSLNLGQELKTFGSNLQEVGAISTAPKFDPTIAAGFTELGSLIIRFKAQSDARTILVKSDPDVRKLLSQMARSIGSTSVEGVRGTVKAHWNTLLAAKKLEFISTQNLDTRRSIASDFLTMMQHRNAQDEVLVSFRTSLLSLADLHHALLTQDQLSAKAALDTIGGEIQRTETLKAKFEKKDQ